MDDILVTDNQLEVLNGDLKIADGDNQNMEHLLLANKGDYVESPFVGVGILTELNGPGSSISLESKIRRELRLDGFKIESLRVENKNTFYIKAKR